MAMERAAIPKSNPPGVDEGLEGVVDAGGFEDPGMARFKPLVPKEGDAGQASSSNE